MHTQKWAKQSGFTIVELLIVVVVIAILAAITIVSYNGIQDRAKQSSAQSAASQVSKKVALWQVDNPGQTPLDLGVVGINTSSSSTTSFYYTPGTGGAWCATVSTSNKSYKVSNTDANPVTGGCAGHPQNGIEVATNYITNPSLEESDNLYVSIGNPGTRTIERLSTGGYGGSNSFLRIASPGGGQIAGYGVNTQDTLSNGDYVGSLWVRSNVSMAIRPYFEGTAQRTNGASSGPSTALSPGVWTRLYLTINITAPGTIKVGWLTNTNPVSSGTYVDMDAVMLTGGTALNTYADGNSSNWVWNGAQNASTSKGVPF
jgi:prepilin-type N-terminal cleavage/methylation domain-containing protein